MKKTLLYIISVIFLLTLAALAFCACGKQEPDAVTLTLDPGGTMHMISYHPGQMDAVMSICTVRRGGDIA